MPILPLSANARGCALVRGCGHPRQQFINPCSRRCTDSYFMAPQVDALVSPRLRWLYARSGWSRAVWGPSTKDVQRQAILTVRPWTRRGGVSSPGKFAHVLYGRSLAVLRCCGLLVPISGRTSSSAPHCYRATACIPPSWHYGALRGSGAPDGGGGVKNWSAITESRSQSLRDPSRLLLLPGSAAEAGRGEV